MLLWHNYRDRLRVVPLLEDLLPRSTLLLPLGGILSGLFQGSTVLGSFLIRGLQRSRLAYCLNPGRQEQNADGYRDRKHAAAHWLSP